ncbi:hypothetical protein CEUSTIGMA_g3879.t1 [Chlamydomonas eustigma]|uniref:Phosphotyrosine protein phosphatase I domain-containing protein n=1 Tax=Chlamydomonas eustigma TaxID=1157962 RepID=A0A250X013_9CHLO|nr:hypothetical protein CEUSTIGMA_g3879.t1 [Chlamydomonas eustigma]|eukprot:GAX76434.1 hypothetical protein CEUSTIGMA_g3879.t1 [Chlamydomonas eustigma]
MLSLTKSSSAYYSRSQKNELCLNMTPRSSVLAPNLQRARTSDHYRFQPSTCSFMSLLFKPTSCDLIRSKASGNLTSDTIKHQKLRVIFVCLGNICRSPTAEAVFRAVVERRGVSHLFDIDSCGTGGGNPDWYCRGGWSYHEGDEPDRRMTSAAQKRGIVLTSRSRPLTPMDVTRFDLIIGMDAKNQYAVKEATSYWLSEGMIESSEAEVLRSKNSLMTDYCRTYKGVTEVPDPYYGGPEGFERVLDLLYDACEGLLDTLLTTHASIQMTGDT